MEKQIIFRDYAEQQAQDHTDLQDFTRQSIDHIVIDAITKSRRFSGLETTKTAQAEFQITAGRFYDSDGAVYNSPSAIVQSVITYLPAVAKRCLMVSVRGSSVETDVEERDYLVDVATGRTEPRAQSTVRSRLAVVNITSGVESADPQPPTVPVTDVPVAIVTLDATSILSVDMQREYAIMSTEGLDLRAVVLEEFKTRVEPRVNALASTLSALEAKIDGLSHQSVFNATSMYKDLARLKENADLPQDYSNYGSDNFHSIEHSDSDDSYQLGYKAQISNGLSFPPANIDSKELALYSANDSNATVSNGLVLPKYTNVTKIYTWASGSITGYKSISQYGYQTFEMVQHTITRSRLRYGPWWGYYYPYYDWYYQVYGLFYWWPWATYYPWILGYYPYYYYYWYWYYPYCWVETWTETYWELETIPHSITGAQIAQTFLVSADMYATVVGIYISEKGGNENIFCTICEVIAGVPDLSKVIAHTIYPYASIVIGWNNITIQPTFLSQGKRYAAVFTSNANHKVGMTSGQNYLDGTFFYSTDSVYYLGDLTQDLAMYIQGAQFDSPQRTIQFTDISLNGGIRAVDLTTPNIIPKSTELVWEVSISGGSGEWIALTEDNLAALTTNPVGFHLRGRFVGTRDVAPAVQLTGSRMQVSRPDVTFKHVSELWTLDTPTTDVTVQLKLVGFDETPHDLTCRLYYGSAYHNPNIAAVDVVLDAVNNVTQRTFHFTPLASPACSSFLIVIDGTTTSAANLFNVTEMLFWTA